MIGWYAHHHGGGHLSRARAVRPWLAGSTLLTSAPIGRRDTLDGPVVRLPHDAEPPGAHEADGAPLHYAPPGHPGVRSRAARLGGWLASEEPSLLVVDVSVEAVLLARLFATPVALVRQHGERRDRAHAAALDLAQWLVAPYPAAVEGDGVPAAHRERTFHAGWVSRFDGRTPMPLHEARHAVEQPLDVRLCVVLRGRGDAAHEPAAPLAERLGPDWHVVVVGSEEPGAPGFRAVGFVNDPWPWLCAADVVVAPASNNCVAEVRAAGRPLVVVPRERPFDEQRDKAACLERAGEARAVASLADVDVDVLSDVLRGPQPARAHGASRHLADHLASLEVAAAA